MQKSIEKKELNSFIDNLIKNYEVYGPIKDKNTKYKQLSSSKELYLDSLTEVPAKELFLPDKEKIFDYIDGEIIEEKPQNNKRIIFGLRNCDLNSLLILDKVLNDPLYISKRKNTILIGLFCDNPDKFCFCNSMGLVKYFDLFFYPYKDIYVISVGSNKGLSLVRKLKDIAEIVIPDPVNYKKLINKDIEKDYHNKAWESDCEKCLSCSACTVDCPTCNCFDIKDTLDLNLKDGSRHRSHMSCQLRSFSQVAGGKVFRDSRLSRFKHFVYHKIVYYYKKHNRYMCVGCGRCLRVCPTKIDWTDTINLIKDFEKTNEKNKKK